MTSILAKRRVRPEAEGCTAALSDEDLLDRYLGAAEPASQEAFRELMVRHGPMVLGVCRHVLSQAQDAEDAFQATFVVLARRGATIRDRRVLAGWLHEVAYRISLRLRSSTNRRRALERQGLTMYAEASQPDDQGEKAAWEELRPVLHEEVNQLPEKYRVPVILSYLEGKTNEEVAALLRWPVGTVKGRLSRARELLRSRLVRRGLALSAAFLMSSLSRGRVFAEVVPTELVQRTMRFACPPRPLLVLRDGPASPDSATQSSSLPGATESLVDGSVKASRLFLLAALFFLISLTAAIGSSLAVFGMAWRVGDSRPAFPRALDSRSIHATPATPAASPDSGHCQ